MGEESRLDELLSLWEQHLAQGRDVPAAELCRDQPELLAELEQRIVLLRQLGQSSQASITPRTLATQQSNLDSASGPMQTLEAGAVMAFLPAALAPPGYELLGELGRGGMGIVYRARHLQLDRVVALKMILSGGHASAGELARFKDEARAIARLLHPNIVQIYDVGEQGSLPYFSLEYCSGGSLDQKLAGTPLKPKDAAALVETLARAMQAAHEKGIVHRDLKPANVLLASDGTAKVTDFGLAKKLDEDGRTRTGAVMGTPSYMAPEQAGGQKGQIGPATDVYALGAILYECLTGRPPFKANSSLATLRQVVSDEPVPPGQLQSQTPKDLETIALKCLQKEAAKRYARAADLAEDLRHFQAGEPIVARPVGPVERLWRWCRRNPGVAGLTAAVVALLLAALVGLTGGLIVVSEARRQEAAARKVAEDKEHEARYSQYVAEMNLVQREYEVNNLGHVRDLLAAQVPRPGDSADFRGFEWHYWQRLAHRERHILAKHENAVHAVAFSPHGRRLATASSDQTVRIWETATGKELLTLKENLDEIFGVAFSPDGRRLALAGRGGLVRIWDAAAGKELFALPGHTGEVRSVAFSPDGRTLASTGADHTVRLWDAATGKNRLILQGHTNEVGGVAFSADSQRLASAGDDQTVRIWDTATGKQLLRLHGHTAEVRGLAFSADSRRLASAGFDHTVRVWDAATGKELFALKGHTDEVWSVAFGPDGRWLASAGADKTVRVWEVESSKELFALKGHTRPVYSVAFRPDGRWLASASEDETARIWDAENREIFTLAAEAGTVYSVAFRPDGQRLASANADHTVRIWDASTGQELLALHGHTGEVRSVAFSPDGLRLATASADQTVRIWDAATGKGLLALQGLTAGVGSVTFSPDGQQLASGSADGTVRIWDAATGQTLSVLRGHQGDVRSVAFSPDGGRLASASNDETAHVWDLATERTALVLKGHVGDVLAVSFRPDGARLATAGDDETVRLWDAATGQELLVLRGHTRPVLSVSFSPDSRRLASASEDGTVRLWDAATGKELLSLKGHAGEVRGVAFSPDGRRLASAGDDETVCVWEGLAVPHAVWRRRELVSQVASLAEELGRREKVLAALRQDATLDSDEREFVLQLASKLPENAGIARQRSEAAWRIVKAPNAGKDAYARALSHAEAAARLAPEEGSILTTLGAAQYRASRYADALATLTKAEKLNTTKAGSHPRDLAFLVLTQNQFGKKDEARATLGRLRDSMKQPLWAKDAQAVNLLHEAEKLIEGKGRRKRE